MVRTPRWRPLRAGPVHDPCPREPGSFQRRLLWRPEGSPGQGQALRSSLSPPPGPRCPTVCPASLRVQSLRCHKSPEPEISLRWGLASQKPPKQTAISKRDARSGPAANLGLVPGLGWREPTRDRGLSPHRPVGAAPSRASHAPLGSWAFENTARPGGEAG